MSAERLRISLCRLWLAGFSLWLGCQAPVRGHKIAWHDPNKPGEVAWFTVYAQGPLPENAMRQMVVRTNEVELGALLGNAPGGKYRIYVVSTGTNELSSTNSKPYYIHWTPPVYLTNAPALEQSRH